MSFAFDGTHTGQQLMQGTPGTLDELLTVHGRELLTHPTGPRAPVRLHMASGDEQAVTANTEHLQAALLRDGVEAPIVDPGTVDYHGSRHLGSNVAATSAIVRWFREFRRQ